MASSFSGLTNSIVLVFLCVAVHVAYGTDQENNRPVMFIFEDSIADVGTNNFLTTRAKGNVPYLALISQTQSPLKDSAMASTLLTTLLNYLDMRRAHRHTWLC
ncbi:hypothetical protein K1719_042787 [Acacia pycnantha]|nr:hypothetical protein K1719_042787 [Acacia pycnantha]